MSKEVAWVNGLLTPVKSQGVSNPSMAQVSLVIGKGRTQPLVWESGITLLRLYRVSESARVVVTAAIGAAYVMEEVQNYFNGKTK